MRGDEGEGCSLVVERDLTSRDLARVHPNLGAISAGEIRWAMRCALLLLPPDRSPREYRPSWRDIGHRGGIAASSPTPVSACTALIPCTKAGGRRGVGGYCDPRVSCHVSCVVRRDDAGGWRAWCVSSFSGRAVRSESRESAHRAQGHTLSPHAPLARATHTHTAAVYIFI